jgi:hypothetical protein
LENIRLNPRTGPCGVKFSGGSLVEAWWNTNAIKFPMDVEAMASDRRRNNHTQGNLFLMIGKAQ